MRSAARLRPSRRIVRSNRGAPADRRSDLAAFPCPHLCVNCGYLLAPPSANGYRQAGHDAAAQRCPACGGSAWVDLRHGDALEILADTDSYEATSRRSGPRVWLAWLAAALSFLTLSTCFLAAGVAGIFLFYVHGFAAPMFITSIVVALAALVLFRSGRAILRRPRVPARPARWRYATRHAAGDSGAATATSRLVAPLSGRECVAYEIGVRHDDRVSAPIGTWLLLEQRHADLRVGRRTVAADTAWIELGPRQRHVATEAGTVARYLRTRGLSTAADVQIYETILAADDAIEVNERGALERTV